MAASSENFWAMNSMVLKFLLLPFRWCLILFFVISIVFGVSLVSQSYSGDQSRTTEEAHYLELMAQNKPLWQKDADEANTAEPLHLTVYRFSYEKLYAVFFRYSGIEQAWQAQTEKDKGFMLKQKYLVPHANILEKLMQTLKLISLRLGYIAYFVWFALIFNMVAVVDGFMVRAIRQQNASRESAGLYHRAKYWRSGILWLGMTLFLAWPTAVSPYWLFIPTVGFALLVWLQAKYLKKYL